MIKLETMRYYSRRYVGKQCSFNSYNLCEMKLKFYLSVIIIFLMTKVALGQDIHFSQFYFSPLNLSPALVGVHSGEVSFMSNYRSQWESVGVDYMTFSGTIERKIYLESLKSSYFAAGLLFNFDQAGTSQLSRTNLGVSASYSRQITPVFFMTAGGHLGINQRAFRTKELTFDNQFNGEIFDPNRPRESFDNTSVLNIDLSGGLNFRIQPVEAHPLTKRSKIDFGVGVHHLTSPSDAFYLDDGIRTYRRYSAYVLSTLMLNPNFDVIVRGATHFEGSYRQTMVGAGAKIFINRQPARELAVLLGGSYRFHEFGDAMIPHIEFHIQQWILGLSYDVNISELQEATDRQGGIEVALRYLFTPVKPPEKTKVCPII